jgi:hypothetical protein
MSARAAARAVRAKPAGSAASPCLAAVASVLASGAIRAANSSKGLGPGVNTRHGHDVASGADFSPAPRNWGSTPARTSEDLPAPDTPTPPAGPAPQADETSVPARRPRHFADWTAVTYDPPRRGGSTLHPDGAIDVSYSDDMGQHWVKGNGGQDLEQSPNASAKHREPDLPRPPLPDLRELGRHPNGRQVHPVDRRRQQLVDADHGERQHRRRRCPDKSVPAIPWPPTPTARSPSRFTTALSRARTTRASCPPTSEGRTSASTSRCRRTRTRAAARSSLAETRGSRSLAGIRSSLVRRSAA